MAGCGSGYKNLPPGSVVSTSALSVSLYPYTTEDLKGPCAYELRLPASSGPAVEILVVFERGDTRTFFDDPEIRTKLSDLHIAMVFAQECDAETTGSFQADASKGPARVLISAIGALAVSSGHPELSTAGMGLFGYSSAGVLTATMVNEQPDRIVAAIEYLAGDAYVNIANVPVSDVARKIPTLILANSLDQKSGTTRILRYYAQGRATGAPWALAVQHATDHCCSLTTRSLVLPWLAAVTASKTLLPLAAKSDAAPAYTTFTCTPDGTTDVFGNADCAFSAAEVHMLQPQAGPYGWLPDAATGSAWLTWVLSPDGN